MTSGAFVRFWLRGCGGNQPTVTGVGIIGPSQGGVFYFDLTANGSGLVSGTIYSTRDATGVLGGDISCGGSTTAVWYGMQLFQNGKGGPEIAIHAKSGVTLDITSVIPITSNPVVTAPTGDSTYARLDASNQPFLGSVTPSGNGVLNLGALSNRWNGYFNNLNISGTVTGGNFAIKPQVGDAVQYVSTSGNDSNDGLSWGSAKLTIGAAITALPTVIVSAQNYPSGTVRLGGGSFSLSSGVSAALNFAAIVGQGRYNTTVNCTASVCFTWNNSSGTGGDPAAGGLYNFTLSGNASASQVGISTTDGNGLHLVGMKIVGFSGTNAIGWQATNSASQTERTLLMDSWFANNTTSISLTGTGAHNSFSHGLWLQLQFNLSAVGQTAIALGANVNYRASLISGVINNDNASGNTYAFSLSASTTSIGSDSLLELLVDNNGGGTVYGVNFLNPTPLFSPWGVFAGYTTATLGTGTFMTTIPGIQGGDYLFIPSGVDSGLNTYILHPTNPAAQRTLSLNDPGGNASFCLTLQCLLTNPTIQSATNGGQGFGLGVAAGNTYAFLINNPFTNRNVTLSDPGTATTWGLSLNTGIAVTASKRNVSGCTTGSTAGNACASPVTVTWPASFPNLNYSVVCTPVGAPTNFPSQIYVVAKAAGNVTVNYIALTNAAASWPAFDCTGYDD